MINTEEVTIAAQSNGSGVVDFDLTQQGAIQILERITDGFVSVDREWRYNYINRTGAEMAGRAPAEFIGKTIWELYPEAVGTKFQTEYERALRDHVPVVFEEYLASVKLWLEVNAYPSESGLSIFFRNITEKKQAEARLRESEELLQGTINALTGHIAVLDKNGVIVKVNETWRRFAEENLFQGANYGIGQNYIEACIPNGKEPQECDPHGVEAAAGIRKVASGELEIFELEYPCHSPNEQRWFVMRVTRFNETKNDLRVVVAHENITERKLAENALRKSRQQYQNLFTSIDEGFCIFEVLFDAEGNGVDYRFVEINPAFEKQTGLQNAVGKTIRQLVPDIEARWSIMYGQVAKTGEPVRIEADVDSMNRIFDIYAFRVGEPGANLVAALFNNITERKLSEEALRESEEKLRRTAKFNEFSINLADALRPLSDPVEIQATAGRVLGEWFNANRVLYFEMRDGEYFVERDFTNGVPSLAGSGFSTASFDKQMLETYRSGRVAWSSDTAAEKDLSATERAAFGSVQIGAYIGAPIFKNGEFVAGLSVQMRQPHSWAADDIALVEEAAERTWEAVTRARAEQALAKSEEKYRTLFDSIDEGFCVIEVLFDENARANDYRFVEVNAAFEVQTGMQNVEGRRMLEFVSGIEEHWLENYGNVALTGQPVRFANEYKSLSRWFDVYAFRTGLPAERKVGVLFKDITERKQTETSLRHSEEFNRTILESSPDCVKLLDLNGNLLYMNSNGRCIMEVDDFEELRGRRWCDLWRAEAQPQINHALEQARRGETTHFQEFCPTAKGTPKWWDVIVSPVRDVDGQPTGLISVSRDITERKQAEQTLLESDARLRLAIDISRTATFDIDLLTDVVQTDEFGRDIYGFEADEPLTFDKIQSHFHPEDRDEVLRRVSAAFDPAGAGEFEVEQRIIRTDGETRWIRVRGRTFFEGEGDTRRAVRCLGTYIDITDSKKSEIEFKQVYERFLIAEKASNGFVYEWNLKTNQVERSSRISDVLGYSLSEIASTADGWREFVHPLDYAQTIDVFQDKLLNGGNYTVTYRVRHSDGHWVYLEDRGLVIRDENGEPERVVGVSVDVTARKEAEAALAESVARYRYTFEQSPVGVLQINVDGTLKAVNPAYCKLVGYEAHELVGKSPIEWTPVEDHAADFAFRQLFLDNPIQQKSHEKRYIRKDGEIIWVHLTVTGVRDESGNMFGIGIVQDITERKRAEEKLKESEALFRELSEVLPAGVFIVKEDRHIYANAQAEAITGYGREELLSISPFELTNEAGHEKIREIRQIRLSNPDAATARELPLITKSGELRWVLSCSTQITLEGETAVLLASFDITDQKRAQEALRESEERLRLASDAAQMFAWETDLTAGTIQWSENAANIIGCAPAELPSEAFDSHFFVAPEDSERIRREFEKIVAAGGRNYVFEFRGREPKNERRFWQAQGLVIYDDEQPVRVVGITQNITQRKIVEENAAFLADIAEDLAGLETTADIMNKVAAKIGEYFNAVSCAFTHLDELTDTAVVQYEWHAAGARSLKGAYRITEMANESFIKDSRAGKVIVVRDAAADSYLNPEPVAALGIGAYINVPFIRDGEWQFQFAIHDAAARDWRDDEIAMMRELTTRIWTRLERARAEAALRESEARFRNLADSAPVLIWVYDTEGCEYVNRQYLDFVGVSELEDVRGIDWAQFVHPDDYDDYVGGFSRAFERHEKFSAQFRFRRHDGEYRWMTTTGLPRISASGEFLGYVGSTLDIDDIKRAENALRESEERFRNMADNAPVMVWVTEKDGYCSFLSKSWYEFTGQTPETGLGFGWVSATHPDDQQTAQDIFVEATEQQKPFYIEYRLRRKDGSYSWAIDSAIPRLSPEGEFLGFIGSVIDITERKNAENEIRRLNQELQAKLEEQRVMLDLLPIGVSIAYDANFEYIYANNYLTDLMGMPTNNVSASNQEVSQEVGWRFTKGGVEISANDLPIQQAVYTGKTIIEDEFEVVLPNRTEPLTFLSNAAPLFDENGKVRGAIGGFLDITERKRAEDALREADRRKDEFLATLAHELRNPLAPIQTALEIMRSGADREKGQEAREIAARQIEQMRHLIDDLLDISRITQGKIKLKLEQMDLRDAIESAIETSLPLIQANKHQFSASIPDKPIYIEGDAVRLSQIFLNLLNNAAKFTDAGGKIDLTATIDGGEAVVKVKDTGAGIPPEMLESIFEMFSQVEKTGSRPQGGLGIGLNLVRRLTEKHGGTVTAASQGKNMGSEFTVRLPLTDVQKPEMIVETITALPASEPRKLRLLVVDDNVDAADMMSFALSLEKHEIKTVYNGTDAIAAAKEFQPDACLLDIGLPDIDGYNVAQTVRAAMPDVLLVALSGWGQEEDRRRSSEAGFNHHLVKPVKIDEVIKLLTEIKK